MFQKKNWKDRQSEYPNRRLLVPTGINNEYDVARAEGTVVEGGDPFNAQMMNDLEDRVGRLVSFITISLPANGWSNAAPFTQTVNIPSVLESSAINSGVILGTGSVREEQKEAYSLISEGTPNDGSITFICDEEKPSISIDLALTIFGGA